MAMAPRPVAAGRLWFMRPKQAPSRDLASRDILVCRYLSRYIKQRARGWQSVVPRAAIIAYMCTEHSAYNKIRTQAEQAEWSRVPRLERAAKTAESWSEQAEGGGIYY